MLVTKSAYDALQRECDKWSALYESLLEKYHALRIQGSATRPIEAPTVIPAPQTEYDRMVAEHKEKAIRATAAEFQARGVAADLAYAEAERLIGETMAPLEMQ